MAISMNINNLPRVEANLLDGNLGVTSPDLGPAVLVIGTGTSGRSEYITPIGKLEEGAIYFGTGSLSQGITEARNAGAKNLYGYRIGATAASVANIGNSLKTADKGVTVTTALKDNTIGDDYYLSWDDTAGRLRAWDSNGTLIYDNNPTGLAVDNGELYVEGDVDGVTGSSFGTSTVGIKMSLLDETVSGGVTGIVYTAGTDGSTLTLRALYEFLNEAYRALVDVDLDIVVPMGAFLDDENIADDATLAGTSEDFLGWCKITIVDGEYVYTWSSLAAKPDDHHEVNFAHQLAGFCYYATKNFNSCRGIIGANAPDSSSPGGVYRWVGTAPTKDVNTDVITVNGTGLLGNKFTAGTTARDPGFFATSSGFLDGTVVTDAGEHNIDIGKYIDITPGWHTFSNTYSTTSYIANAAAMYGGATSRIAANHGTYNIRLSNGVVDWYKLRIEQMDDLAGCSYTPTTYDRLLGLIAKDAPSAALSTSDYALTSTVRIAIDFVNSARTVASPFIGLPSSTIQRSALKGQLEEMIGDKITAEYINSGIIAVNRTASFTILGEYDLDFQIVPAFLFRKLNINLGLVRDNGL